MIGFAFSAEARRVVHRVARRSISLSCPLCWASKPGVAPAGDSLSFASPKESKQRKGDPQSGSHSGQPAVLEASGVWLNSLRSNNASPGPLASALLGPARTGWERGPDIQHRPSEADQYTNEDVNSELQETHFHKYAPWRVLVGPGNLAVRFVGCSEPPPPRRNEEASSASADGSGLALSERSEFSQTPAALSNAAYRRSRATNPARLSFAYFSLAKQRKVSSRRPTPGQLPLAKPTRNQFNSCLRPYSLRQRPKVPEKIFSNLDPQNNQIMQSLRSHRQTALLPAHQINLPGQVRHGQSACTKRSKLTIPCKSPLHPAVQSNKVYLPQELPVLCLRFVLQQINAIR